MMKLIYLYCSGFQIIFVQSMNSLMLHSCKNLAEEKQILRDINIQKKDVASFKSLEVLKKTVI